MLWILNCLFFNVRCCHIPFVLRACKNLRCICGGTNREVSKVKLATIVEGNPKAPFSITSTPRCKGGRYSFPGLLYFTLDPYLIMLSVKQGGIKYHFLSLWYDSTWDWTQVSRAIGEHSNRLANVRYNREVIPLKYGRELTLIHYMHPLQSHSLERILVCTYMRLMKRLLFMVVGSVVVSEFVGGGVCNLVILVDCSLNYSHHKYNTKHYNRAKEME